MAKKISKVAFLNKINKFYPDNYLRVYYTADGEFNDENLGGDGLAEFIVNEAIGSWDDTDSTNAAFEEFYNRMSGAGRDISGVLDGVARIASISL